MKCICCKRKIKAGEFVVLSGGALRRVDKDRAVLDSSLLGFFSINNHFDSSRDYRGTDLVKDCGSGQFELYACSHKCLAVFFLKEIIKLSMKLKNKKGKDYGKGQHKRSI